MGNVMQAFPELVKRHRVDPGKLVHVGAHEGQEMRFYYEAGFTDMVLVEPIPELAKQLRTRFPGVEVVQAACSDHEGEATLNILQRTNMSTLLEPGPLDQVTRTVGVALRRLDAIAPDAQVAVIDAQGHELEVLSAAPWDSLQMVIVETCTVDDPTVASSYDLVTEAVTTKGFVEVDRWTRDYDWVSRWARGNKGQRKTGGEIRDVVFLRGDRA